MHRIIVDIDIQTGENIYSTCLLGFFSTKAKCNELIKYYLKQPGFKDFPDNFVINSVILNEDFNNTLHEFNKKIFFLSHEWYDGVYDHVSYLGYYSTRKLAEKAMDKYKNEPEFVERLDGFNIDEYEMDEGCWLKGFDIS